MTLGQRLKIVRTEAKLSLEKVGSYFNITAQTLSRYENGERRPDNEFLNDFGKRFKLSGDWLLYGDPPMRKTTNADKNINDSFYELVDLIKATEITKDIPEIGIIGDYIAKITEDNPDNFILMLKYMLKYAPVRKSMFQFFYLFQKPLIDEGIKLLQEG